MKTTEPRFAFVDGLSGKSLTLFPLSLQTASQVVPRSLVSSAHQALSTTLTAGSVETAAEGLTVHQDVLV